MNKVDKHWKEIEDNINWSKIHKTMVMFDWKWFTINGKLETPSLLRIKNRAKELFYESFIEKQNISTGGLKVEYFDDDCVSLSFVLDWWDTCI